MATDGNSAGQVTAIDLTAGIQQLEDNYGGTFSKAFTTTLQKAIDPLRVSVAEWKGAIEFIMGRYDRRPSKNQIIDGIRAVRGEAKGSGTIQPPAAGAGACPTCKGSGCLWHEKDGYRSIILCGCDNGASKRFYMTHTYVPGKDGTKGHWHRNKLPEPPTLEAVKADGADAADIMDSHHCKLHETEDTRRERVHEILRQMHRAKKPISVRMEKALGLGVNANRPPPPLVGVQVVAESEEEQDTPF